MNTTRKITFLFFFFFLNTNLYAEETIETKPPDQNGETLVIKKRPVAVTKIIWYRMVQFFGFIFIAQGLGLTASTPFAPQEIWSYYQINAPEHALPYTVFTLGICSIVGPLATLLGGYVLRVGVEKERDELISSFFDSKFLRKLRRNEQKKLNQLLTPCLYK